MSNRLWPATPIRTAAVWVIGTATLSTPIGQTSLGNYIFAGLQTQNWVFVLFGCFAAAVLALRRDGVPAVRILERTGRSAPFAPEDYAPGNDVVVAHALQEARLRGAPVLAVRGVPSRSLTRWADAALDEIERLLGSEDASTASEALLAAEALLDRVGATDAALQSAVLPTGLRHRQRLVAEAVAAATTVPAGYDGTPAELHAAASAARDARHHQPDHQHLVVDPTHQVDDHQRVEHRDPQGGRAAGAARLRPRRLALSRLRVRLRLRAGG